MHPGWQLGWSSSALLAERNTRFETNVSRLTCVSKSDTTQKLERQRVDGNEQQLHRVTVDPDEPCSATDLYQSFTRPEFLVRRGPARGEA